MEEYTLDATEYFETSNFFVTIGALQNASTKTDGQTHTQSSKDSRMSLPIQS